jgi:hypothetical protein
MKMKELPKRSIKDSISEIIEFVQWCKKNIPELAGFNLASSKLPQTCYIIAKSERSFAPVKVLKVLMDALNPTERPLIVNAINMGIQGKELSPGELEDEMVCKADKI